MRAGIVEILSDIRATAILPKQTAIIVVWLKVKEGGL
jgi:hypothetical protein